MFRTYKMSHSINKGKLELMDALLSEYRVLAKIISNRVWRDFYMTSKIDRYFQSSLVSYHLTDRYKQTCAMQVKGIIKSYLANKAIDFKDCVFGSSITDDRLRHDLFYINKSRLWFSNEILFKDRQIPIETIKLARCIIRHIFKINRKPKMKNISMMLDSKVAVISKGKNDAFDYWISLSTNIKYKTIKLPIISNDYFENIKGKLANFVQINKIDDKFEIFFIKDVRKEEYEPKTDKIGLALGKKGFLVSSKGDIFGQKLYPKLKEFDDKITYLLTVIRRSGIKPRDSKRYRKLISKLKSYLKNELSRVINSIIKRYNPKTIYIESLVFWKSINNAVLSKRMNNLIYRVGKKILVNKLNSVEELLGISIKQVNPTYISQTCSSCGYIAKTNRKNRDELTCGYCGKRQYSDVSSAKNIEVRSSNGLSNIFLHRVLILDKLVREFIERHQGFYSKRLSVIDNPYFVQVLNNSTVKDPINKRISP